MVPQEKTKSFMQQLDEWTDRVVIEQLVHALSYGPEDAVTEAEQLVRKAIREKILESYRNGQAAQLTSARKRTSYAKR
jgi:hypothetical protein